MVHTVHTNRDKQERSAGGREGGDVRDRGGRRGTGQHDVCFVTPKWGKVALTYHPPHVRKKNTITTTTLPPTPPLLKNNNTGCQQRKRRETMGVGGTSPSILHRQETESEMAVGSHCGIFTSVCDWLARRQKENQDIYRKRKRGRN